MRQFVVLSAHLAPRFEDVARSRVVGDMICFVLVSHLETVGNSQCWSIVADSTSGNKC